MLFKELVFDEEKTQPFGIWAREVVSFSDESGNEFMIFVVSASLLSLMWIAAQAL